MIDQLLKDSLARLPFIRAIWVLDADGNMILDSAHLPGKYKLSDRSYFKVHRDQAVRGLFIDRPIRSKLGVPFIGLSWSNAAPDGGFKGVSVAAIEPDYLNRFFDVIRPGADGVVALVHADGTLMLRVPSVPASPDAPVAIARLAAESAGRVEGRFDAASVVDGVERSYFFRRVARRPLVVAIGYGRAEMLAGWRRTALAYGAVSGAFLLLITALAALAVRELRRSQAMNRAVADSAAAMKAAQRLAHIGSWRLDLDTKNGQWSDEMYRILGLPRAPGPPPLAAFLDAIHPDDRPALRRSVEEGADWEGELRSNPAHGAARHFYSRASAHRDGAGKAIALMGTLQDVSEYRRATTQLQFLNHHDPLTRLPNRALLGDRLLQAIEAARPEHRQLGVLLLNVDRLKRVNEGIGHDAGDLLLREIGARLLARLQPGDTLARLGSDEFVMLLTRVDDADDINACAQMLIEQVAQPFKVAGHELTVTASIGIALYPEDGATPGELIKNADTALAHVKQGGRNRAADARSPTGAAACKRAAITRMKRMNMNFPIPAAALLMCALASTPSLHAAETRPPTDQELASFKAFQLAQPAPGAGAPVFDISRDGGAQAWRVQAYQDGQPRRALRALCRMNRKVFSYDGQWRSAPPKQFAWHDAARCAAPAAPIALGQRMPDTDILALIEQQAALLKRARLLFAGNTTCAPQRAYNYRLSAIDVGIFIDGSEEMATLTYLSDRGPTARVWARRTGLAYDPWNVSCP